MPLWNTPQSGGNTQYSGLNCVALFPGDDYALLDGSETVVSGSATVHFANGAAPNEGGRKTFALTGCALGSTVDIQASNGVAQSTTSGTPRVTPTPTNMDASFVTIPTSSINGNGFYTDEGASLYYRAIVSNLANGDVPVLIVTVR